MVVVSSTACFSGIVH